MNEFASDLVIEDEELIQSVVAEALTDGGFSMISSPSGEEALTLFTGGRKNYKALVTDVGLKGPLTGWGSQRRSGKPIPCFPWST